MLSVTWGGRGDLVGGMPVSSVKRVASTDGVYLKTNSSRGGKKIDV